MQIVQPGSTVRTQLRKPDFNGHSVGLLKVSGPPVEANWIAIPLDICRRYVYETGEL